MIDAAISLIDREGPEMLSMRRLGASLGVEAMALYNHFDDREAILDSIADRVFESMEVPSGQGPWERRLSEVAHSMRRVALSQPNVFKVAMSRPTKPTRALPLMNATLAALRDAGLDEPRRVEAYSTLASFIRGFLIWEIDQTCMSRTHGLPAVALTAFEDVNALTPLLGSADASELFAAGIEHLLAGVRAQRTKGRRGRGLKSTGRSPRR